MFFLFGDDILFLKNISKYGAISSIAGIIDFLLAYFLFKKANFNYMIASNIGIAVGFLFQFLTGMKYVFKPRNYIRSFVIYLVTLVIGVMIANGILWVSFDGMHLSFMTSKLLSMVLPFFFIYFLRRILLEVNNDNGKSE